MNKEIWKPVVGFEGVYEVSNFGKVRGVERLVKHSSGSYYTKKSKELKLVESTSKGKKYYAVKLSCNGVSKTHNVHKIVAMAFLNHSPCKWNAVIDHIDGDGQNNRVDNLQILTNRENISKGYSTKDKSSKYVGVYKLKSSGKYRARIWIKGRFENLGTFDTEEEAGKAYLDKLNSLT